MIQLKESTIRFVTVVLVFLSISLRVISLPYSNFDLATYNLPWYQILIDQGISKALATNFSNYSPPYTYFLALATLTHGFLPPIIALKLIPVSFDLLGAFYIYKIVRLKYQQGYIPYLAAAIYFTAPTVILNSSYWGQADSLYTVFLLACLYYLMAEKPFLAMLAFGIAFAFKAQAVFFFPFLCLMAIRKRIPWIYFGIIPLVYLIAITPVVLLGRPLLDTLLIYASQSSSYTRLSVNAPNLYLLFSNKFYALIMPSGLLIAIILLIYWIYTSAQSKNTLNPNYLLLTAFIATAITPFLLPKMHDRYFYPADVLSIPLAFYWPTLWFIPILYQFISIFSISVFLFEGSTEFVILAAILNTITIAILLRHQRIIENRAKTNQKISSALSWGATILTPIFLFGLILKLLLTSYFVRLEYNTPYFPADEFGFSKYERITWSSQIVDYLKNEKDIRNLARLKFENGIPVFNDRERFHLESIKVVVENIFTIWRVSLLGLFILGLLSWIGDWQHKFRNGINRGGKFKSY